MIFQNYLTKPRAVSGGSLTARQVAKAYGFPIDRFDGKGFTCGIIELGGGFGQADLRNYFGRLGVSVPEVVTVTVGSGQNKSDGPNGADGEVLLDIEVAGGVAPGAKYRVYFAGNTDEEFLAAIQQAAQECDVISISWGGPESQWDPKSIKLFSAAFLAARKAGVITLAAAGDSGSDDGTSAPVTDYPACDPNVIACGGTRLTLLPNGNRFTEVTWDDDDKQSATGGGLSRVFPGRATPDIAGNADPESGYQVVVDGQAVVVGGTSAVAPLYAGLVLLLSQAIGRRLGTKVDFMNTLLTNLGAMFDVTAGDNGAYRAGPGRDQTTGLGVIDGGKLLAVLTDGIADPAPIGGVQAPPAKPTQPAPQPAPPAPAPTEPAAALELSAPVLAKLESAAKKAGETDSAWLDRHLRTYFKIKA